MDDLPNDEVPDEAVGEDENLQRTRKLLASVEELRALLAPLTPDERERVLRLARDIAEHPDRPSVDQ